MRQEARFHFLSLRHSLLWDRYVLEISSATLKIACLTLPYLALNPVLEILNIYQSVRRLQHINRVFILFLFTNLDPVLRITSSHWYPESET